MDIHKVANKIKGLQTKLYIERSRLKDEVLRRVNNGTIDNDSLTVLQNEVRLFESDELSGLICTNNLKNILKDNRLVNRIEVDCTDEDANDSSYIYQEYCIKIGQIFIEFRATGCRYLEENDWELSVGNEAWEIQNIINAKTGEEERSWLIEFLIEEGIEEKEHEDYVDAIVKTVSGVDDWGTIHRCKLVG